MDKGLMYICSPYRGRTKRNTRYAAYLTRIALEAGFIPVTPHLYMTKALNEKKEAERKLGMQAGIKLLERCDCILIGLKYGISEGMEKEIEALDGQSVFTEENGILTPRSQQT